MTDKKFIVSREEWGAIQPEPRHPYFPHVPTKIIFHHYGFPPERPKTKIAPLFKGCKSIRKLQRENIKDEGLIDIKFHYIIGPDGFIYEGRPSHYMGKHLIGGDNGSIGILVYGNFNVEPLTFKIKEAILWLLLYLRKKHNTLDIPNEIYGHSCKKLTSCPGIFLQQYILKLRNRQC